MAADNKGKRKVFFVKGNGTFSSSVMAPGDILTKSSWNPGRSKNKFKKKSS